MVDDPVQALLQRRAPQATGPANEVKVAAGFHVRIEREHLREVPNELADFPWLVKNALATSATLLCGLLGEPRRFHAGSSVLTGGIACLAGGISECSTHLFPLFLPCSDSQTVARGPLHVAYFY